MVSSDRVEASPGSKVSLVDSVARSGANDRLKTHETRESPGRLRLKPVFGSGPLFCLLRALEKLSDD